MNLNDALLDGRADLGLIIAVTVAVACARTTTPTVASHAGVVVTTGFDFFFLALVVGPTRRQFGALEFFLTFFGCSAIGSRRLGNRWFDRAHGRFVQSSFFGPRYFGGLGLFWFFCHQNTLGCIHHGANGFGLCQSLAAAFIAGFARL